MQKDIEQKLLGEMLITGLSDEVADAAMDIMREEFFTIDENKKLFQVIKSLWIERVKADTVAVYTRSKEMGYNVNLAYVSELSRNIASTANMDHTAKILAERWYKRSMKERLEKAAKEINIDMDVDALDVIKLKIIEDLGKLDIMGGVTLMDLPKAFKYLDKNIESTEQKIEGYSWGLLELDELTSGIRLPTMVVVGALKKAGKTRFAIFLRRVLFEQGVVSPFLSMEVPPYELTKLTMASFMNVNDIKFRPGMMSIEEKKKYYSTKAIMLKEFEKKLPTECISGLSIVQVIKRIKYFAKRYPRCVIIIDYMQRIEHNEKIQAQEFERFARQIADVTRKLGVAVILLSQLRNEADSPDITPSVSHLKGSGGIAEAADIILILDNIARRTKDEEKKKDMDIYVEQRYGEPKTIHVGVDLGRCAFLNSFAKNEPQLEGRLLEDKRYSIEDNTI
jgi:replicative DNA helicase